MVSETVSERRLMCNRISETLATGAVDRGELLTMVKELAGLAQELSWEVKGQLRGRNDTPEIQQASRWISSAQGSLTWAEKHAQFGLTFELARCVEIANSTALKVVERLQLLTEGAAA
jgi:hypothetical protein